jgi:hypothetical protein
MKRKMNVPINGDVDLRGETRGVRSYRSPEEFIVIQNKKWVQWALKKTKTKTKQNKRYYI